MAGNIKGIVVEIGGDTVGLQNALADVNQQSRSLYSELRQVDRMLQFDPGNVELLAQREEVLNQQIETTQEKLTRLRSVYAQVEQQFARGDIGAEQWRRFQREIITTEQRLQRFQGDMHETEQVAEHAGANIKESLTGALMGAVAGKGLQDVVSTALESTNLKTKINVSFDVPEESKTAINNAIGTVEAFGLESETALAGVRKQWQLNGDLTDAQNTKLIEQAGAISTTYSEIDFTELITETNKMAKGMGITQEQALGLTNQLLKMGFPPDQVDIISEYGQQLHRAGFNAQEIQGIMNAGIKTGNWNFESILDGLKEGRIKMAEFSQGIDKTTAGLLKQTGIGQKQFQQWGSDIAQGGEKGKKAMESVGTALNGVDDARVRNQLGVAIFGTMYEDSGDLITEAMKGASTATGNLGTNVKNLGKDTEAIKSDPTVKLHQAMSNLNTALQPVYDFISKIVGKIAEFIEKNPTLAATITAVAVGIGILLGIMAGLAPILTAIVGLAGLLGLELTAISLPILAVIAIIGALIAIGVLLYKNWGEIKTRAKEDWAELMGIISGIGSRIVNKAKADWAQLVAGVKEMGRRIKEHFNTAVQDIKDIWGKVTKFFKGIDLSKMGTDIMNGLKKGIANAAEGIYRKAKDIAGKVIKTLKNAFATKSPSKITTEIGSDVGAGLEQGLRDSIRPLQYTSIDVANAMIGQLDRMFKDKDNVVTAYFEAIQEDGDYLNDMLVHMPKQVANIARQVGQALAPDLEGTRKIAPNYADWDGNNKGIYVSINSPVAIDTRTATKEFNRTMSRITNLW